MVLAWKVKPIAINTAVVLTIVEIAAIHAHHALSEAASAAFHWAHKSALLPYWRWPHGIAALPGGNPGWPKP